MRRRQSHVLKKLGSYQNFEYYVIRFDKLSRSWKSREEEDTILAKKKNLFID